MPRPNIVFILSDQQRADTMGHAGDPVAITPHLDQLAAQGSVFSRCYTSSPVCMPARASIMTGYRKIRDAGYRTGIVGKTHLWRHGEGHASDHEQEMHD